MRKKYYMLTFICIHKESQNIYPFTTFYVGNDVFDEISDALSDQDGDNYYNQYCLLSMFRLSRKQYDRLKDTVSSQ